LHGLGLGLEGPGLGPGLEGPGLGFEGPGLRVEGPGLVNIPGSRMLELSIHFFSTFPHWTYSRRHHGFRETLGNT